MQMDNVSVFKLSDVANLYKTRLEQLDVMVTNRIHTTRLKDILISVRPDLRANSQGRDILLLFEKNIGPALMKACDHDGDAMHLVRAAQVVRREMFETRFTFDGAFQADSQKDSLTPSLLALVNMISDGANNKHQTQLANISTTLLLLHYRSYWCSTVLNMHAAWSQPQCATAAREKLHSHST